MKRILLLMILSILIIYSSACSTSLEYNNAQIEGFIEKSDFGFEITGFSFDEDTNPRVSDTLGDTYQPTLTLSSDYFCSDTYAEYWDKIDEIQDMYDVYYDEIYPDRDIYDDVVLMNVYGECDGKVVKAYGGYTTSSGVAEKVLQYGEVKHTIEEGYDDLSESEVHIIVQNACAISYETDYCKVSVNLNEVLEILAVKYNMPIDRFKRKYYSCNTKANDSDPMTSCSITD